MRSAMALGSSIRKMNILNSLQSSSDNPSEGMRITSSVRSLFTHDENDKNAEKKENSSANAELNIILKILEDIRLQKPIHHTGLVVAYSSALLAPIVYKGIKFTWYRQGNEDNSQFVVVDDSLRSWYAPTVDDIGCKICVQCEDSYQQGFSRYVECDAITADPLLCSLVESALKNSYYEASEINVSMGLEEKDIVAVGDEHENTSVQSNERETTAAVPEHLKIHLVHEQITTLSTESIFFQFSGHSSVSIDSKGLFISIPVARPDASSNTATATTNASSAIGPNKPASRPMFRTSSRGLRIPPSNGISVHCSQPAALVLVVPIRSSAATATSTTTASESSSDLAAESEGKGAADPSMSSFLSSATLTIPWVYEGIHSPEAIAAVRDPHVSDEQRERLRKEAEEDSINFANMVVSLAEFIASMPDSTTEIKICLSCPDRLQRDVLASAIRSLLCQAAGATSAERLRALPWLSSDASQQSTSSGLDESSDSAAASDIASLRLRMKALEEDNYSLKRERNELFEQIMIEREASVKRDLQANKASITSTSQDSTSQADASLSITVETPLDTLDGQADKEESSPNDRVVTAKLIELETRLSVASRREVEESRLRKELEVRNEQILSDNDQLQKQMDELKIKFTVTKHDRDMYEHRVDQSKAKIEELEGKIVSLSHQLTSQVSCSR
jgi:hypothetical protein